MSVNLSQEHKNLIIRQGDDSKNEFWVSELAFCCDLQVPHICPNCSQPADNRCLSVFRYSFSWTFQDQIAYGLIGHPVKYLFFGSNSKIMLRVNMCSDCIKIWKRYKIFEWLVRFAAIIYAIIFVVYLFKSLPIEGDLFNMLFCGFLIPLVVASIFVWVFRACAERKKGVAFCSEKNTGREFRVKSSDWLNSFMVLNERIECLDEKVINDFKTQTKSCPECENVVDWADSYCDNCKHLFSCPTCGTSYHWDGSMCGVCDKQDVNNHGQMKKQLVVMSILVLVIVLLFIFIFKVIQNVT